MKILSLSLSSEDFEDSLKTEEGRKAILEVSSYFDIIVNYEDEAWGKNFEKLSSHYKLLFNKDGDLKN